MKKRFLEQKKITSIFAAIALITGLFFLNYSLTGNVVLNNQTAYISTAFVGIGLIICSFILTLYSLRKK